MAVRPGRERHVSVDREVVAVYVHTNMNRIAVFFRKRVRHSRPRQLELNLWPKRQRLSPSSWNRSVMAPKTR